MCSNHDDGLRDMLPDQAGATEGVSEAAGICHKCKCETACTYKLRCREPECRECFLNYVRHKFRGALGASRLLPRGARVLLAFDGGATATTLLDMLYEAALAPNTHKRLHCEVAVLHIDETGVTATATAEDIALHAQRSEHIERLHDFQTAYRAVRWHVAPLQHDTDALTLHELSEPAAYLAWARRSSAAASGLAERLAALRSLTARQDYVRLLRQRLIVAAAARLDCAFVFLPDIASAVATQLLVAVALGRGGSAAWDVGLLDDRHAAAAGVQLIRPIRELTQAEVRLYLHAKALTPPATPTPTAGASIYNLTESFVSGLQRNYNSTVSTVSRTGSKIAPNRSSSGDDDDDDVDGRCAFCAAPLGPTDSATLLAIEFSRLVSGMGAALDAANIVGMAPTSIRHTDGLCHACENIRNESANKDVFST